ncbi:MAG: hypothetical protein J7485_13290 [Sphingobium sp.]|nr:hypothetical protein [Sphingobium sp.]
MSEPLRLRIHVSEPFDFERENPSPDLFGTTIDHLDTEAEDWLIQLETGYTFHEEDYAEMLLSPRYVGEHLSKVFDSILGVPVRIAHRIEDEEEPGWHFAMTGMITLAPPPEGDGDQKPAEDQI